MIRTKGKIAIIIIGIGLLLVSILSMVIASVIQGNDILAMLSSKWAIIIYIMVGLYALVVGFIFFWDWMKHHG